MYIYLWISQGALPQLGGGGLPQPRGHYFSWGPPTTARDLIPQQVPQPGVPLPQLGAPTSTGQTPTSAGSPTSACGPNLRPQLGDPYPPYLSQGVPYLNQGAPYLSRGPLPAPPQTSARGPGFYTAEGYAGGLSCFCVASCDTRLFSLSAY